MNRPIASPTPRRRSVPRRRGDEPSLRRAKVRDLQAVEKIEGDVSKTVALAAHLAEVSPEALGEMDAADFAKVAEAVSGFLG